LEGRRVACGEGIVPIDGEGVLDEIVRPNRKEIRVLGQAMRAERRGRKFDHASDRRLAKGKPLVPKLFTHTRELGECRAKIVNACDRREHHAHRPVRRGTEEGAQLRAKEATCAERIAEPCAAKAYAWLRDAPLEPRH